MIKDSEYIDPQHEILVRRLGEPELRAEIAATLLLEDIEELEDMVLQVIKDFRLEKLEKELIRRSMAVEMIKGLNMEDLLDDAVDEYVKETREPRE